MTKKQRLQRDYAALTAQMRPLIDKDGLTGEEAAELARLTARASELQAKIEAEAAIEGQATAAALDREPEGDPQLAALVQAANIGRIMAAVIDHAATEGPERELQQHLGLGANQIPLAMFRDPEIRAEVTPAPANVGRRSQPVVMPVFAGGDAAFMSVDMPTVAAGDSVFPVLTTRPAVGGPHAASEEVGETTGGFTAEVLEPERLQASFFWRRRDAARFPDMPMALRSALSSGLSEKLDSEVVARLVAEVTRTDASAADDFASYRKRMIFDRLDGRFASMEGQIRMLAGNATVADMSTKYRANSADDSALDSLRRISGGVKISPHIPAVATGKQDVLVRRGMRRDAVAPVWDGVTLIPDEVTKAATGEIVLTAVMLMNTKVLRAAGFARIQSQHA